MKTRLLISLLIGLLLLVPVQAQEPVSDLLGRINSLRASLGLAAYTLHPSLSAAAQNHAQWMASTGEVSHVQPDGSRPRDRAQAAGYGSSWVSENIYIGGFATVDSAWQFWLNSPVHYAGMTSPNYQHIGIATASGSGGRAFVLVFGNPGGSVNASSGANVSSGAGAPAAPPSFVVGVDAVGNLMHEVQPGDTLGDIALMYGYTWSDIPYMLQINGMSEADVRSLDVGSVFLVPPYAGTYTPTPLEEEAAAETETPALLPAITATSTIEGAIVAPSAEPPALLPAVTATAENLLPEPAVYVAPSATQPVTATLTPTQTPTVIPLKTSSVNRTTTLPTSQTESSTQNTAPNAPPLWLVLAVIFQLGVLGFATLEFFRRTRG